jgi:mono/diheme cytochrome c family protein
MRSTLLAIALLACLPTALLGQPQPAARSRAGIAQSTREFLGLGPAPDAAAAKRGAPVYAANCAFCHGPLARGAEGPSLIYSEMVLKDQHGAQLAEFLKGGRPEKGMPAFATLSEEQRKDIAEFVHQQIEDVANRGTYEVKNILLGDAPKGSKYVAAHCLDCHSITRDLKGLAAKWRPVDLQRNWIMPPRTGTGRAITATVRTPQGTRQGRVQQIDDFRVVLAGDSGEAVVIERGAEVAVELHDPLAPHVAMVGNLADSDMINVTAYLITDGEVLSIQKRLVAQPRGEGVELLVHELYGTGLAQLRPFLIGVDVVDDEDIPHRRFHGVECRNQPLDRACAGRGVLRQKCLRALRDMKNNRARLEQHCAVLFEDRHLAEGL